ncbi:hypothetical protein C0992_011804, partial [Termitomyces sp. T32_za158]
RSIEVYGTIGREHNNGDPAFAPITMYMIDGRNDSTEMFTGEPNTEILYKQLFYQSPELSDGQHKLVVTLTTQDMNTMWIDYFQIEASAKKLSPGLIAGVVVGGIVVIALLVTIGILSRRICRRRRVRYEKLSPKATHAHLSWMSSSSSPGKLTPFGSDPFSDTRPLDGVLRPFSVHYTPYSPDSLEPPELSNETSLSGYTVRGDTAADKTTTRQSRESTNTGYTSLSGYTTQGGTSAEKTASSSTSNTSQSASRHSSATGNTSSSPRHTVHAKTDNRSSRPSSGTSAGTDSRRKELPSSTTASSDVRTRPLTSRVFGEGEEVPPAYSTDVHLNLS